MRLACRVLGHRYRFRAEGAVMIWKCQRSCGAGGAKAYASAAAARQFAAAFDREDRDDLGRRAPLIGLLPLRAWRAIRRRRSAPGTHAAADPDSRRQVDITERKEDRWTSPS